MLTLKEINEVSFGKAGFSGYKPEDVDNFIDEVVDAYKQLSQERDGWESQAAELMEKNAELQEKLAILAKKVESYREDEDGIKDAILSAQRMSKQTVTEAKNKVSGMLEDAKTQAEALVSEAKSKSVLLLSDARNEAETLLSGARSEAATLARQYAEKAEEKKHELDEVKKQVAAFRASLLEMYRKHLEQINHIPVFRVKQSAAQVEEVPVQPEPALQPVQEETVSPRVQEAPVMQESQAAPAPVEEEIPVQAAPPVPVSAAKAERPRPQQRPNSENRQQRPVRASGTNTEEISPLKQRVDYAQKQEKEFPGEILADMGIVNTHAFSIPETLRKEKESGFSNLEFGDGVDITHKR